MSIRFDSLGVDKLSRTTNIPSASAFTIAGFIMPLVFNTWNGIFSLQLSTGSHAQIFYGSSSGDLKVETAGGSSANIMTLLLNEWHFVALVGSGVNDLIGYGARLGAALSTQTASVGGSLSFTPNAIQFAENVFGGEGVNGRLAGVRVWDVALDAAELLAESKQIAPVRTANLNSFFPMADDILGTDVSGNARHMTVGGTLTFESNPPVPWSAFQPASLSQERRIRVPDGMSRSWSN